MINKEKVRDILYQVYCEFSNEIDTYETTSKRELTEDDINIMFEFLNCFIDKTNLLIDEYESEAI